MFETIALAGVLMVAKVDHPTVQPRAIVNTWKDSGSQVWAGVPRWIRDLSLCIRKHESINAGHYRAHSGKSSAAGAYQMLDRFWQGNARWAEWNGKRVAAKYKAANHAPAWVQDVVFIHSIRNGGIKAWKGTGCRGTE